MVTMVRKSCPRSRPIEETRDLCGAPLEDLGQNGFERRGELRPALQERDAGAGLLREDEDDRGERREQHEHDEQRRQNARQATAPLEPRQQLLEESPADEHDEPPEQDRRKDGPQDESQQSEQKHDRDLEGALRGSDRWSKRRLHC
jgi:hypothetical protein